MVWPPWRDCGSLVRPGWKRGRSTVWRPCQNSGSGAIRRGQGRYIEGQSLLTLGFSSERRIPPLLLRCSNWRRVDHGGEKTIREQRVTSPTPPYYLSHLFLRPACPLRPGTWQHEPNRPASRNQPPAARRQLPIYCQHPEAGITCIDRVGVECRGTATMAQSLQRRNPISGREGTQSL